MNTKYDWLNVPDEVNWIATDEDGVICGYSQKPRLTKNGKIWLCKADDISSWVCNIYPFNYGFCENWRDSLEERP